MPYAEFCQHRGAAKVQELTDAGALETWQEENGIEMVAELTRSVGGETVQRNTIGVERERSFFFTLSICCGPRYSIRVLTCRIQFFTLNSARSFLMKYELL